MELLLSADLVRKHQFGTNIAHFEKAHGFSQHDHVICTNSGEVIEFCDPRIENIKNTIEELFKVKIHHHSLYFYAEKIGEGAPAEK
jgi:Fur family ferric uptake transcriptional regulator